MQEVQEDGAQGGLHRVISVGADRRDANPPGGESSQRTVPLGSGALGMS